MFKLLKIATVMGLGMLLAPKKGIELRKDFVEYLNKYKPQIKKFILVLDETWEKAKISESDEVALDIETKLINVREAANELDAAKTKEIAYNALLKLGKASIKIAKGATKSPVFLSITKDLSLITVNAIDSASNIYSKVQDVSTSFAEDVQETSKAEKTKGTIAKKEVKK